MSKRIFLIIGLALLGALALFAIKFAQINQTISQMVPPAPPVVAVAVVLPERWALNINTVGSLKATAGVAVNNEIPGIIKAIHFESGQSVKAGQILLELDASLDIAQQKGLQAEVELTRIRYDRNQKMIAKHYVSQSDMDQSKASYDQALALLEANRTTINKKTVRAPFAGELAIRQVNLGQYLAPGTAIVDLQQLSPLYVDFSLPERYFSQIQLDQSLQVHVQAYEDSFQGTVVAVSPEINSASRNVQIRGLIPNVDKRLKPGMFAQIDIVTGRTQELLTIPDTAVSYNAYGNSVFVILNDANHLTVQNRQIVTGQTRHGRVEVISGLVEGDRVVSAGQLKLRNGMPVQLDDHPAPGERN